jgi:hypothetical protein
MMSYWGFVEIVIDTLLIFGAFFVIGGFLRGQLIGADNTKLLIFFLIVALAGGLIGAHSVSGAIARHNRSVTRSR